MPMTDAEWLTCRVPGSLLYFIVEAKLSSRKLQLYEYACDCIDTQTAEVAAQWSRWGDCPALDVLRDIFGNPFRPSPPLPPAVLAWNDGTVRRIAQAIYEVRKMPEGTFDN